MFAQKIHLQEIFWLCKDLNSGLFQLASRMLFDKYVDFIDVYAQISEQEQKSLYREIIQHKETAMLAQYIRDKGMQQGMQLKSKDFLMNKFTKLPASPPPMKSSVKK